MKETQRFIIVADNLCLDFLNTQIVNDGKPKDLLNDFEDLVEWTEAVKLIEPAQSEGLIHDWARQSETKRFFAEVKEFRRALREMVEAITKTKAVKPSTIKMINAILNHGYGYHELVKTESGFEKRFRTNFDIPRQLLIPIAESAADLISGNSKNIRKCESPTCILYFYDITKNHGRRWCSMNACGNRAKAAAFYKRTRKKK